MKCPLQELATTPERQKLLAERKARAIDAPRLSLLAQVGGDDGTVFKQPEHAALHLLQDAHPGSENRRRDLVVFIEAAKARKDALDHVLFVGPPLSPMKK